MSAHGGEGVKGFSPPKPEAWNMCFKRNNIIQIAIPRFGNGGGRGHGNLEHPSKNDIRTDLIYVLFKLFGVSGPKALFAIQCWLMGIKR